MEHQESQESVPRLCSKGCGFFSNAATMGMCSKCFREEQAAEEKAKAALAASAAAQEVAPAVEAPPAAVPAPAPAPVAVPAAEDPAPMDIAPASTSAAAEGSSCAPAAAAAAAADPSPMSPSSAKPNRCQQCRKKVGLTGFSCKCGALFCGQHRYAEAHNCTFDYRAEAREKLAANNPLVQASKLERI